MRIELILICFFTFVNCNVTKNEVSSNKIVTKSGSINCNDLTIFNNDSAGTVIGAIKMVEDTSNMSGNVFLLLSDRNSTERSFYASYGTVDGLDIKKLTPGNCIRLTYYTEIQREEGEEVSRSYYVTKLQY